MAKQQIRDFIKERNRLAGTTTILTSHDMKDLDCVCKRLIVLAKGSILFDGSIERFKEEHASQGVSDIEDMVRSIYEEEMAIV